MMRIVLLAALLALCGCVAQPPADPMALVCNEKPEGPGIVHDVEHIPGTTMPAPPALAQALRDYEAATYSLCLSWWKTYHP